jgi:hypothetical protein
MEEIIEGCFKLFFAIVFFLCAPVITLIYAWYGLGWVWRHLAMWWAVNGTNVMFGVALVLAAVLLVFIVGVTARRWWELHLVNSQRQRAVRQLGRLHQQSAVRMDEIARLHRTAGTVSQSIVPVSRPGK